MTDLEHGAQPVERPPQPRAHGRRREVEHRADLVRAVVQQVAQDDDRTRLGVEGGERAGQVVPEPVIEPLGRRLHAFRRDLGAAAALAQQVERAVHDDPVQPRLERAAPVEVRERPHGREHRVLADVLGRRRVAHDQERRAVRPFPVAPHQRLDGVRAAALRGAHQRALVVALPRTARGIEGDDAHSPYTFPPREVFPQSRPASSRRRRKR
jgi:hypothetical protein